MAEVEECSGSLNSTVVDGNDWSTTLFSQLKTLSVQLLELLQCPEKNSPAPSQLLQLLRQSPPSALQALFEYDFSSLLLDSLLACLFTFFPFFWQGIKVSSAVFRKIFQNIYMHPMKR